MKFRKEVSLSDIAIVKEIVESTGFFYNHEVDVAVELIEDSIKNPESTYKFVFIEKDNTVIGYSCFGEIPCTRARYDIYWFVVHNTYRGKGIGKVLLKETEKEVAMNGGEIVYLETSSQEKYLPTRKFYEKNQYLKESVIKDFYDDNDDKVTYSRRLIQNPTI